MISNDQLAERRFYCLNVANEYLQGNLEHGEAMHSLASRGSFGNFLAGELSLEQASLAGKRGSSLVSSYITRAEKYYRTVMRGTKEPERAQISNQARSGARLAQLGLSQALFSQQKLPRPELLRDSYGKTIKYGCAILRAYPNVTSDTSHSVTEVKGVLSELAAMSLVQRHTLRENDGEESLAIQSLFSEDNGGNCDEKGSTGSWDMTIFTQYDPKTIPEATYKVQTKTTLYYDRTEGDITTVSVLPDLQLHPGEGSRIVLSAILFGCEYENNANGDASRITNELNERTAQMLDVLG